MIAGNLFSILLGFSGGVATGAALCAFYVALGVFSKLNRLSGVQNSYHTYIIIAWLGVLFGVGITIFNLEIPIWWLQIPFGFFGGAFIGVFIASLAEVTNILPCLYRESKSKTALLVILIVFAIGKVSGALITFLHDIFI